MFGFLQNVLLFDFTLHILAVPSLMHYLKEFCPDVMAFLKQENVLDNTLKIIGANQQVSQAAVNHYFLLTLLKTTKIVFNTLEGNGALCMTANLVTLFDSTEVRSLLVCLIAG
jgi:hypothetical protein